MNVREVKGFAGTIERMKDVLVFMRIMTNEHAQVSKKEPIMSTV